MSFILTMCPFSAPDTDCEVRWCLLKLADLLIRGAEEAPPKVTIHLPPTPVAEAPPPIPAVKLSSKPQRPLKTSGVSVKSPRTPFTLPPKLKLVPSSSQVDVSSAPTPGSATPQTAAGRRGSEFPAPKVPPKVPLFRNKEKKVTKAVPKAQTSGMSMTDLRACKQALKKLQEHKKAAVFLQPVDPVRDRAPK